MITGIVGLFALGGVDVWKAHASHDFWPIAVPGLLTGLGTLALAGTTYAVLRGDQIDRRAREEAQRREQATRVHVAVPERSVWQRVRGDGTAERGARWTLKVINASEFPIFNLDGVLSVTLSNGQDAESTLPPSTRPVFVENLERLLPREEWSPIIDLPMPFDIGAVGAVKVAFFDVDGTRWKRDADYRLTDITGQHEMLR